jgi:hypothetical protein
MAPIGVHAEWTVDVCKFVRPAQGRGRSQQIVLLLPFGSNRPRPRIPLREAWLLWPSVLRRSWRS